MTANELNLLIVLRLHFKCTPTKLAKLVEVILGESWAVEKTGCKDYSEQGRHLILLMEDFLGVEPFTTDYHDFDEYVCSTCHEKSFYIAPDADIPVDCEFCENGVAHKCLPSK